MSANCLEPRIHSAPRILVLDGESNVRRLFARWLNEAGFCCLEARDAAEAREQLRRDEIPLMTLDVRMPGESGIDLVHQLKSEFPDTVILMVTGVDLAAQAVQAMSRGAFGYLIKPVDGEQLLFHVRAGLAARLRQIADREYLKRLEEGAIDANDTAPAAPLKSTRHSRRTIATVCDA